MTDAGNAGAATPCGGRRAGCWWRLLASLALNLVVVGSVAGAMWRFREPPPWAGAVTPNLLGYASTLPAERRKELWEHTAEERRHIRPFRREVRAAREETIKALVAEPFDRRAVPGRPGAAGRGREHARGPRCRTSIVKIADSLTPEERRAFPRWREHRRPPGTNLLDEPDQQAGEPPTPALRFSDPLRAAHRRSITPVPETRSAPTSRARLACRRGWRPASPAAGARG